MVLRSIAPGPSPGVSFSGYIAKSIEDGALAPSFFLEIGGRGAHMIAAGIGTILI